MKRPLATPPRPARGRAAPLVALAVLGCAPADTPARPGTDADELEVPVLARPVIVPAGPGAVRLLRPAHERPLAVLSTRERRVYVDRGARDTAQRLLGAHISVSTGLWRVHLAGDDLRVPVVPGDSLREFVETPMEAWDPRAEPAPGDVRVRRAPEEPVQVLLGCVPVTPGGGWVAGTLEPAPSPALDDGARREEFVPLVEARRHADRDCADEGAPVTVWGWRTAGGAPLLADEPR